MAEKGQCLKCKSYQGGVCRVYGTYPQFDNRTCSDFVKNGINLKKSGVDLKKPGSSQPTPPPAPVNIASSCPTPSPISITSEHTRPLHSESVDEFYNVERPAMFSRAFSFEGRIRRTEFGLSVIIYFFAFVLCTIISGIMDSEGLLVLSLIPLLWFYIAQNVKRFHDRNMSGWSYFLYLIPIYNIILFFCQIFSDGDPYENDYGCDPKGRDIN